MPQFNKNQGDSPPPRIEAYPLIFAHSESIGEPRFIYPNFSLGLPGTSEL